MAQIKTQMIERERERGISSRLQGNGGGAIAGALETSPELEVPTI